MARNLSYLQISQAQARSFDFKWVMENSWNSTRWSNDQSLALVHWVEPINPDLTNWMRLNRINPSTINTHEQENEYIRDGGGSATWDKPAAPPRE